MGFEIRKGLKFFPSKHLKQNITVSDFEITFFCHCFVAFGGQKGPLDP
jgi:hypothetical protein